MMNGKESDEGEDGTHADEKPQVAFMPQMAMVESQLISLSLGERKEDHVQSSTRWTDGRDCR